MATSDASIRVAIVSVIFSFFGLQLTAQQPARLDISPFGVLSVNSGEKVNFTATASPDGNGCRAALGFLLTAGGLSSKSLTVNLAAGRSASVEFASPGVVNGRELLRPVAWTGPNAQVHDCLLSVQVKDESGRILREIAPSPGCEMAECRGIPALEAPEFRVRVYLAASEGQLCHAQMGFRFSSGKLSSTSKYVSLLPNHAEWLDWRPGADDFSLADFVIPVVVFHQGDKCAASAETFSEGSNAATRQVNVQMYASDVIGLAMDPSSLPQTILRLKTQLENNPTDLWAVNALAQAYDNNAEPSRAINLLLGALQVAPRASETWLLLAKFQYEKQDYRSAAESLEKCLALDPGNVIARAAYASSLSKLQRLDEAEKLIKPLIQDKKTRTPPVLTAYSDLLYTQGRFSDALLYVEEADLRHPNCENTLYVKARILQALNRSSEATAVAERVVQIDTNSRLARLLLLKMYVQQGRTSDADNQKAWLKANIEKNSSAEDAK